MIWLGSCTGSRCADHRRMNNVVSASTSDHLVSYASSLAELLYFSCGWHVPRRYSRVVHELRRWEATRWFTSCFLQGSYWETVLPSSTRTLSSRPRRVGRLLQHSGVSSRVEMKNVGFWRWKMMGWTFFLHLMVRTLRLPNEARSKTRFDTFHEILAVE